MRLPEICLKKKAVPHLTHASHSGTRWGKRALATWGPGRGGVKLREPPGRSPPTLLRDSRGEPCQKTPKLGPLTHFRQPVGGGVFLEWRGRWGAKQRVVCRKSVILSGVGALGGGRWEFWRRGLPNHSPPRPKISQSQWPILAPRWHSPSQSWWRGITCT